MAKRFITPFAEAGDRAEISNEPIGSDVNMQTGYPAEYEADPVSDSNARFVERDKTNQIFNDITANIKEWQENTYPAFITTANNGGTAFAYKKGDRVSYNGDNYESLEDANQDIPTTSKWIISRPTDVVKAMLIAQGLSGNYGFFDKGFEYVNVGDVGIDDSNHMWVLGSGNANVAAGTVPSEPDYIERSLWVSFSRRVQNTENLKSLIVDTGHIGLEVKINEYYPVSGYGGGKWRVVTGKPANGIDIIQSDYDASVQYEYASSKKSLVGIGAKKDANSATYINRALTLSGEWKVHDGTYIIESQLNASTDNAVFNCESRSSKFLYSSSNAGNLLAIKSKGFRFNGGTIDGGNLVALVGDATEDGSLVCAVADTEFKFKDTLFANVMGDNSILGKQALLNINNQGVVFDLADCDFLNCRIKKNIESAKDSQFVSFKGNAVTKPTRGRIHGGSMIGVGAVLDSGVPTDKDGKCVRGYFNESSDFEFDIEVTGVYSTEFDEAFAKTTGMKGINIHDNNVVGVYTQPWDNAVTKSEYFVRNTMITKSSGVTRIHDNTVRGIFNKLIEAKHSTSIQGNSFSIRDSVAGHLNVLYEISEYGVDIANNTYELETIDKVFNFIGTPEKCSWRDEQLGFTMDGDEGTGLGKRLVFGTSDIQGFKASDITLNIATTNTTSPTDIVFLNSQLANGNISGLEFENFTVNTNNFFNYVPRISGNNAVVDGVSYTGFAVKYTAAVSHAGPYALSLQNTTPRNVSFDGFEIQYNGIVASSTTTPLNLDEVGISKFNRVYIHDINPNGNTVGFLARFRGDASSRSNGLDLDGLTFKNMKSSQSRLIDISNQDNANFSSVRFLNTVTTSTKNGLQFTSCNNITVDSISANDDALTVWASMVDINSGDNYVVGKVNCRGAKVTFGTATNTVDNTI